MSVITAIVAQERNKERVNLFVDGEFYAGVSLETVLKLRLKAGEETDAKKLSEIIAETERTEAIQKAGDYALKTLKTKRQVKDYLLKKGYSEDVVWYCVDKLKEYGYIDDKNYSPFTIYISPSGNPRCLVADRFTNTLTLPNCSTMEELRDALLFALEPLKPAFFETLR